MPKPKHPYFDTIFDELAKLGQVVPRAMFGHQGYAIGSSLFAFLDENALVVKTERYNSDAARLPRGLRYFVPGTKPSRTWISISFVDSLDSLRKHWALIEESYGYAALREIGKQTKISKRTTRQTK